MRRREVLRAAAGAGVVLLGAGCAGVPRPGEEPWRGKIAPELWILNEDGLRGPPGGQVAVAYEFVIPDQDACKAEVRQRDPSVVFMPGSRGRSGARANQCLCVGSTHQPRHRAVLEALARLPYIERIQVCAFE